MIVPEGYLPGATLQPSVAHKPHPSTPLARPSDWQGGVCLRYDCPTAKTRLASAWHQAPLKIQRPFYPESDPICHTVLIHTAGGMAGGDRLTYDIELLPKARAVITTAAAGKIYRTGTQWVEQTLRIQVAAEACLEWLPQETILFNQAQYQQTLRVDLAPGASWFGWDIYRFGRTARGERFLGGQWRSHTEVWQGDRPLWIDRQHLTGGPPCLDHLHGLNGSAVVGTLVWVGQGVERDFMQRLRAHGQASVGEGTAGASRLPQGLVCRYRGNSITDVRRWFTQVWNDVRFYALGQPACPSRVWQI
ncbi:MAG: urease accessory protein UreD [Thermosynechococcaceae cyanobacterium]